MPDFTKSPGVVGGGSAVGLDVGRVSFAGHEGGVAADVVGAGTDEHRSLPVWGVLNVQFCNSCRMRPVLVSTT